MHKNKWRDEQSERETEREKIANEIKEIKYQIFTLEQELYLLRDKERRLETQLKHITDEENTNTSLSVATEHLQQDRSVLFLNKVPSKVLSPHFMRKSSTSFSAVEAIAAKLEDFSIDLGNITKTRSATEIESTSKSAREDEFPSSASQVSEVAIDNEIPRRSVFNYNIAERQRTTHEYTADHMDLKNRKRPLSEHTVRSTWVDPSRREQSAAEIAFTSTTAREETPSFASQVPEVRQRDSAEQEIMDKYTAPDHLNRRNKQRPLARLTAKSNLVDPWNISGEQSAAASTSTTAREEVPSLASQVPEMEIMDESRQENVIDYNIVKRQKLTNEYTVWYNSEDITRNKLPHLWNTSGEQSAAEIASTSTASRKLYPFPAVHLSEHETNYRRKEIQASYFAARKSIIDKYTTWYKSANPLIKRRPLAEYIASDILIPHWNTSTVQIAAVSTSTTAIEEVSFTVSQVPEVEIFEEMRRKSAADYMIAELQKILGKYAAWYNDGHPSIRQTQTLADHLEHDNQEYLRNTSGELSAAKIASPSTASRKPLPAKSLSLFEKTTYRRQKIQASYFAARRTIINKYVTWYNSADPLIKQRPLAEHIAKDLLLQRNTRGIRITAVSTSTTARAEVSFSASQVPEVEILEKIRRWSSANYTIAKLRNILDQYTQWYNSAYPLIRKKPLAVYLGDDNREYLWNTRSEQSAAEIASTSTTAREESPFFASQVPEVRQRDSAGCVVNYNIAARQEIMDEYTAPDHLNRRNKQRPLVRYTARSNLLDHWNTSGELNAAVIASPSTASIKPLTAKSLFFLERTTYRRKEIQASYFAARQRIMDKYTTWYNSADPLIKRRPLAEYIASDILIPHWNTSSVQITAVSTSTTAIEEVSFTVSQVPIVEILEEIKRKSAAVYMIAELRRIIKEYTAWYNDGHPSIRQTQTLADHLEHDNQEYLRNTSGELSAAEIASPSTASKKPLPAKSLSSLERTTYRRQEIQASYFAARRTIIDNYVTWYKSADPLIKQRPLAEYIAKDLLLRRNTNGVQITAVSTSSTAREEVSFSASQVPEVEIIEKSRRAPATNYIIQELRRILGQYTGWYNSADSLIKQEPLAEYLERDNQEYLWKIRRKQSAAEIASTSTTARKQVSFFASQVPEVRQRDSAECVVNYNIAERQREMDEYTARNKLIDFSNRRRKQSAAEIASTSTTAKEQFPFFAFQVPEVRQRDSARSIVNYNISERQRTTDEYTAPDHLDPWNTSGDQSAAASTSTTAREEVLSSASQMPEVEIMDESRRENVID